jgi:hypothetical protein
VPEVCEGRGASHGLGAEVPQVEYLPIAPVKLRHRQFDAKTTGCRRLYSRREAGLTPEPMQPYTC